MPDPQDALVGVRFHHGSPPYEAGDVAGFTQAVADRYVASGRATFVNPKATAAAGDDPFAAMTRAELLDYARDHLGLAEAPPAEVSDDEIRAGLRSAVAAAAAPPAPAAPATQPAKP